MSNLQIFLFGKFQVRCETEVMARLEARKEQELLCYLLVYRDRPHSRETLANLQWAHTSTSQSKSYLRKALWHVQAAFEAQASCGSPGLLLVEPDWIQFNHEADHWIDIYVFEQAFSLVHGKRGRQLDDQQAQILKDAVDLYRGDLLEGWYSDWCLYERERLKHIYLAMLDKLMGYCEATHQYGSGIKYGINALRYDRARERTHRRLMRLYCLAGYRTEALRQYTRCVTSLNEELGVAPALRTRILHDQIRSDQFDGPLSVAAEVSTVQSAPLPEILNGLERLEAALTRAHRQVQRNIKAVKLALNNQR